MFDDNDTLTAAALQRAYDQGIKAGMTFGTFPHLVKEVRRLERDAKRMQRSVSHACDRYRKVTRKWSLISLVMGIALGLILARFIY